MNSYLRSLNWRGRVGLLVVSGDMWLQRDLASLLPDGISLHPTVMRLKTVMAPAPIKGLEEMVEEGIKAATLLVDFKPDLILFGCTCGSAVGGAAKNLEISARIQESTGVPAVTVSTAAIDALKTVGARSIGVFTPYLAEVNRAEAEFFEECGFKVPIIEGLEIAERLDYSDVPLETIYRRAKAIGMRPDVDTVFISCTNMHSTPIIKALQDDIGKPVLSSVSVSAQAILRHLGVKEPLEAQW